MKTSLVGTSTVVTVKWSTDVKKVPDPQVRGLLLGDGE